jgi:metallo-beta-lactamase class B
MNLILQSLLTFIIAATNLQCSSPKQETFQAKEVYKSDRLVITQIAAHSFVHVSYLQTNDFGNVPCNGLVVRNSNETIVFDTPTNDTSAAELIKWINDSLQCKIKAIVPTHFHDDCLGGLKAFHTNAIPSFANAKTIELATARNYTVPQNSFTDSIVLNIGNEKAIVKFFGEGHTKDNVVGYFPSDHILFGGCLLKEVDASKGFLGDANIAAWSGTVEKIKTAYPDLKLIVPGHGAYGNTALLDYTIQLFKNQ